MKRTISLLLILMMIASVFAACGSPRSHQVPMPTQASGQGTTNEAPTEKKDSAPTTAPAGKSDELDIESGATLSVWASDTALEVTKQLCNDFIAKYPDSNIKINVLPQNESEAAVMMINDPNSSADVFSFPVDQMGRLVQANLLSPVSDPDTITARDSAASVDGATMNGTLYAYPETADNGYFLVYDKSVVSDTQAKTLEDVLQACKSAGKKFIIDAGNGFFSCMFPFTGGLKLEGISNEVQQFNNYDEDEVVDTLKAFSDLFNQYSDTFQSAEVARISSGMAQNPKTVGAGIDGNWDSAALQQALGSNFGAVKLPTIKVNGTDKQIISMHGYKYIGVNALTSYPKAAHALAAFLTDEAAQLTRATSIGWGPTNTKAASDSTVTSNPAISAVLEQSKYSVPQKDVADTFWMPMGTLGNYLWKNGTVDKSAIRTEFRKCITNIKDE